MAKKAALFHALNAQGEAHARLDEPLAKHTMLRLGGPADLWFPAKSINDLITAVSLAQSHEMPYFILGGGANLLIQDQGIRGLVIENRANAVRFADNQVIVESGVAMPRLAKQCAQRGLSGFEWAVGVPGTIGGAVVNNAGAYGHSMAHNLVQAELLDPTGERVWQATDWFQYQYRNSKLKGLKNNKPIVLQAVLALVPKSRAEIEARLAANHTRRKATQPPGATIGSMFKNPPGDYAGRLIEAVGLKGYRLGQAQISAIHANFFVNLGGAKADHVLALIQLAQDRVLKTYGINLDLEIEFVA